MANRTRARSADRVDPQELLFGQLINELRDLRMDRRADRRENFKPPRFNGEGDVELFIQHFTEVAVANGWNDMATLLYLREALCDGAQEYGRPATVEEVFTALRSRYGLTPKEARTQLNGLKRDPKRSLHDHAIDVEKLTRKAFGDLPEGFQTNMMLDTFCGSLGNAGLQRHLLAIQPQTLAEAVQHGQEYLQVKSDRTQSDPSKIRVMEGSESELELEEPTPLAILMETVRQLAETVKELRQSTPKPAGKKSCWGCKKDGHLRSQCPTHPWESKQAGNGGSPQ